MATIAKGMITLVNVNDAYSVSATPNVCAIKADFDGTHPVLDDAYCDITVVRGDVKVPFTINLITPSHTGIKYEVTGTDSTKRLTLTEIPVDALSGTVTVEVGTEDEFVATVIFQYSVMREATMLDWIKDWENNKTTIGSTYLITPKIFVGKREQVTEQNAIGELTGVYIGPSDIMGGAGGPGIYGYKSGKEIFHINRDNAKIANWEFDETALWLGNKWIAEISDFTQSNEITLGIDGIIGHHWRLLADGSGKLAGGNISWTNEGVLSINLNGEDVATTLTSYGSTIASHTTRIGTLEMSAEGFSTHFEEVDNTLEQHSSSITDINGSVTTINGTLTSHTTRIGTLEMSAEGFSTHFEKVDNTLEQHSSSITQNATQITTVVTGLTNTGINITDGVIDLHSGTNSWILKSNGDSMISGWLIKDTRFATDNICLESSNGVMGLYMSVASSANFKNCVSNLEDFIDSNGGIYMQVKAASGSKAASANFAAYDSNGYKVFKLKTEGECSIAGWNFDRLDLYTGDTKYTSGFTEWPYITLGTAGLRGPKWRLENTGGGAIAGGAISWTDEGEITFTEAVSLLWSSGIDAAQNSANEADKLARKLSLVSQQMAYGKMLFRDPEFEGTDKNGAKIYPFGNTGGTLELVQYSTAPNNSQRVLKMQSTQWHAADDHRLTGFYFANRSRANAKFAVRIVANIPVGWKIQNYHNAFGTGGVGEWLTSQAGTGTWEEYIYLVTCGAEGEFSTVNHFALILNTELGFVDSTIAGGTSITFAKDGVEILAPAVTWMVAYATVIDLSSSDKLTTSIDINGIYTGTLRADQIISGTIKTANIMQHEGSWELNQDGSGHLANGNVSWDTSGNVSLNGKIIATEGTIGGFEIGENFIKTEGTGSLQIGDSNFNAIFAVTSETKQVTLNLGINSIYIGSETFNYKTNNQITIKNTGSGSYDWRNIAIANVMNIDYFKSDSPTTSPINRYGYQFAMLGTGHVIMDAIVEGACCDTIHQFTANYQLEWVKPPMYGNRILINSGDYTNCGIVLPDKYSVFSTLGCGVITNTTAKPFTFRLDLINTGNNTIYFAGRGTVTIGSFNTNNEALPYIYDAGGTHRSWDSNNPPTYLKSKQMVSILLVYDGTNYMAFLINKDF